MRRKRYRGTHPRTHVEKYKELDPDRYPEAVARARERGQTPAGSHVPVLVPEAIEVLRPRAGDVVLDATLGHGGHAEALADRIAPGGLLLALDIDGGHLEQTSLRLAAKGIQVHAHHSNFAGVGKVLAREGIDGVDVLLADLGVSSQQIDDPTRGFSYKHDGPLDMRMDPSRGVPAAEWLLSVDEEALAEALLTWGDEPRAKAIAAAIKAQAASETGLRSTRDLARLVLRVKGIGSRYRRASPFDLHPAARVFQAVRMAVNREEESLRGLLRDLPYVLRPGGRAAIISFHGGEDRIVDAAFEKGLHEGLYVRGSTKPIQPSAEEVRSNPRSRSAVLRCVQRLPSRA